MNINKQLQSLVNSFSGVEKETIYVFLEMVLQECGGKFEELHKFYNNRPHLSGLTQEESEKFESDKNKILEDFLNYLKDSLSSQEKHPWDCKCIVCA